VRKAGAPIGLLLLLATSLVLVSCDFEPIKSSVVRFHRSSPGGHIFIEGDEVNYDSDYSFSDGTTIRAMYSIDTGDRYRYRGFSVDPPGYAGKLSVADNSFSLVKTEYETTITLQALEYRNRALQASADGSSVFFIRDSTGYPMLYRYDLAASSEISLGIGSITGLNPENYRYDTGALSYSLLDSGKVAVRNSREYWVLLDPVLPSMRSIPVPSDKFSICDASGEHFAGAGLDWMDLGTLSSAAFAVPNSSFIAEALSVSGPSVGALLLNYRNGASFIDVARWDASSSVPITRLDTFEAPQDLIWCGQSPAPGSQLIYLSYDSSPSSCRFRRVATDSAVPVDLCAMSSHPAEAYIQGDTLYFTMRVGGLAIMYRITSVSTAAAAVPESLASIDGAEELRYARDRGVLYLKNPKADPSRLYRDIMLRPQGGGPDLDLSPDDSILLTRE
jgi:hypothetical protein